jgi:hypothetical protein
MHMGVEGPHFLRRKFTVEVGVEFCRPRITIHSLSRLQPLLRAVAVPLVTVI